MLASHAMCLLIQITAAKRIYPSYRSVGNLVVANFAFQIYFNYVLLLTLNVDVQIPFGLPYQTRGVFCIRRLAIFF